MDHKKTFILNKQKLKDIKITNIILSGFGIAFGSSVLFHYILPSFVDYFSNSTLAFIEEIAYPIISIVPLILFGYAVFVWIAKKFIRNRDTKNVSTGSIEEQPPHHQSRNKTTIKEYLLIVLALLVSGCVIYYAFYVTHLSPEQCFVREMRKWSELKGIEVESLTQDNAKMAVARAKTIAREYDLSDMRKGEARDTYLQVQTVLEYCKINLNYE